MEASAELSPCRRYRYSLTRKWSDAQQVLFVMLNPSTADEIDNDRTIGRCIAFAREWGFGSLAVANLFAFRTPSPALLMEAENPIGDDNDRWLAQLSAQADLTIAAWGNSGKFKGRGRDVAIRLNKPHFLRLTSLGEPSHPLYVSGATRPIPWKLDN